MRNSVGSPKIFLNDMAVWPLCLIVKGPWGLGGRHTATNGKTYTPPTGEVRMSSAFSFPVRVGSKETSNEISFPLDEAA